jgi:hypothetical protein
MTDKPEKSEKSSWTGMAAMAGAAVGSAALAAALMYATRRKGGATAKPSRPEDAPETD